MPAELAKWEWTEPSGWEVTLVSGHLVQVWADAYAEEDGDYVFSALIRSEREPEAHIAIQARAPADPSLFDVALARFPAASVVKIRSS
jgi:hypothetical protein